MPQGCTLIFCWFPNSVKRKHRSLTCLKYKKCTRTAVFAVNVKFIGLTSECIPKWQELGPVSFNPSLNHQRRVCPKQQSGPQQACSQAENSIRQTFTRSIQADEGPHVKLLQAYRTKTGLQHPLSRYSFQAPPPPPSTWLCVEKCALLLSVQQFRICCHL